MPVVDAASTAVGSSRGGEDLLFVCDLTGKEDGRGCVGAPAAKRMAKYEMELVAARQAAAVAAAEIMQRYQQDRAVALKADGSPVTPADHAAHAAIMAVLGGATPDIPVASEEGTDISGERYWSVDPLDGTKEYVARTGAFVVSIALVEAGSPVVGVIHVPVTGECYYASRGQGARKREGDQDRAIHAARYEGGPVRLIGSARHGVDAVARVCTSLAAPDVPVERVALGSAWKFGRIAEGLADMYPRLGPTHTWDTAAGQCIVEEAGGVVWTAGRVPLVYADPRQLNPSFVAIADPRHPWPDLLQLAS